MNSKPVGNKGVSRNTDQQSQQKRYTKYVQEYRMLFQNISPQKHNYKLIDIAINHLRSRRLYLYLLQVLNYVVLYHLTYLFSFQYYPWFLFSRTINNSERKLNFLASYLLTVRSIMILTVSVDRIKIFNNLNKFILNYLLDGKLNI